MVKYLLLLSSLALFSSTSTAAVVYTYQSANFDTFTDNPVPAGSSSAGCILDCNFSSDDSISGFFSMASQLSANLVRELISPDSFEFTAGAVSVSSSDSDLDASQTAFEISTDASGNIIDWYFIASRGEAFSPGAQLGDQLRFVESSADVGDTFDYGGIYECILIDTFGCSSFAFDDAVVRHQPGSWTTQIVPAIPVPAAVWLFGTAIIGLAGISKRRKAA